jgi:ferredoxin
MARDPHLTVAVHADRVRVEAAHRNPRFVQSGYAGQHRRPERGGSGRCERAAIQDGREGRALVRFHRHPDPIWVGAPRQNGGQCRVTVLEQALNSRRRGCRLCGRHRDLVHGDRFSVLEDGLPALARARSYELDQLRFGLAFRHYGCMVPLRHMAYVIVQPCIDVKDASCVEVCPVDCIHTDDAANMYYIDPDECIDCGACVDPCPVDAIFPEDEVPEQWRNFIQINADYFKNR